MPHEIAESDWKLFRIDRRNDEMAAVLDNPRRSVAIRQLALIHSLDLLTQEKLASFRPETQDAAQSLAAIFRS